MLSFVSFLSFSLLALFVVSFFLSFLVFPRFPPFYLSSRPTLDSFATGLAPFPCSLSLSPHRLSLGTPQRGTPLPAAAAFRV